MTEQRDDTVNPYEPPEFSNTETRRVVRAFTKSGYAIAASLFLGPIAGGSAGGLLGMIVLMALPRYAQPSCGNTILDPLLFGGTIFGTVASFTWVYIRYR